MGNYSFRLADQIDKLVVRLIKIKIVISGSPNCKSTAFMFSSDVRQLLGAFLLSSYQKHEEYLDINHTTYSIFDE